mmetsp:Transcript_11032/g.12610  ORF Transcript_11032/g.12610 Transcript_11032/m.12610 type:complete len:179 (-) Transcript_11032:1098-1634(-)
MEDEKARVLSGICKALTEQIEHNEKSLKNSSRVDVLDQEEKEEQFSQYLKRRNIQLRTCKRFLQEEVDENIEIKLQKQQKIYDDLKDLNKKLKQSSNKISVPVRDLKKEKEKLKARTLAFLSEHFDSETDESNRFWSEVVNRKGEEIRFSHAEIPGVDLLVKNGLAVKSGEQSIKLVF